MDIDIDIEEHNILENPALKAIFPDITALKQELEYENEAFDTDPTKKQLSESNTIANACINSSITDQESCVNGENTFLAGKPRKRCNTTDIESGDIKLKKLATLNLPNIYYILNRSNKFCKYCLILFPTTSSFIDHTKTTNHKAKNKDVETVNNAGILTSDQVENEKVESESRTKLTSVAQCFHCSGKFNSKNELINHLYEVLEPKFNKKQHIQHLDSSTNIETSAKSQNKEVQKESKFNKIVSNTNKETRTPNKIRELFYRCHLCSYYFKGEKFFNEHMFNKHENINYTVNKVSFNPRCKFCSLSYSDIKSYNKHIYCKHKVEIFKNKNVRKSKIQPRKYPYSSYKRNTTSIIAGKKAKYLQCQLCYYYYKIEKDYIQHMLRKHSIKNITMQKVQFNAKCRFCNIHYNNIKLYNNHLYSSHNNDKQQVNEVKEKNNEKITTSKKNNSDHKNNIVLPKSTLFKCCKCDMVFISPSLAFNHTEHMEMLINWKCEKCNLYFKKNDSGMHLLQHKYSEKFTVLEISVDLLSKLLYSCPRCTIHFQEDKFMDHYYTCENETPQSVHCSVCDLLIDHEIQSSHKNGHQKGSMTDVDFMTIDLVDIENSFRHLINYNAKKKVLTEKKVKTIVNSQNYNLYFCKTCKCFVSKTYKVQHHNKLQCKQITRFPCNFCGLMLTHTSIKNHRKMHFINKTLKLQDFTFYDLYNGKKISPPIPELPKCKSCHVHCINENDLRTHNCGQEDKKFCLVCKTRMTLQAYEVHMPFHKYEIKEKPLKNTDDAEIPIAGQSDTSNELTLDIVERSIPVGYCCKACSIILNTYDNVIEHCQMHLVSDVIFETASHNTKSNAEVYDFDPFYYGTKNDIWLKHLYGSISNEKINAMLNNSIYKYESRVKMEISQEGFSEFTEYKCGKCNCLVDCLSIYDHIKCCMKNSNMKKIVCKVCASQLLTMDLYKKHMESHMMLNLAPKSFRIVIFNKTEHRHINVLIQSNACKPHVVYKCRNCEGLINKPDILVHKCNPNDLKVCSDCGLSLHSIDYELHIKKHKRLTSFTENNIKVILVGKKLLEMNETNITKNSFIGVVCDYTFYKCSKCEVCIKDFRCTSKHFCLVDNAKAKCWKCGLYLDEGKLKGHLKLHLNDPDFVKENIFTISFDPSEHEVKNSTNVVKHETDVVSVNNSKNEERCLSKLYKCLKCNLHFLTEDSVNEHIKKQPARIKSQNCTKCGYAFSSKILFNHLLEHHGKKSITYNFEVINVAGTFKKHKIFKCKKCSLHFTNSKKMHAHNLKCVGDSTQGEKCKFCGVMFHFSYLLCHEKMHENNMHVDYEVATTEDEEKT